MSTPVLLPFSRARTTDASLTPLSTAPPGMMRKMSTPAPSLVCPAPPPSPGQTALPSQEGSCQTQLSSAPTFNPTPIPNEDQARASTASITSESRPPLAPMSVAAKPSVSNTLNCSSASSCPPIDPATLQSMMDDEDFCPVPPPTRSKPCAKSNPTPSPIRAPSCPVSATQPSSAKVEPAARTAVWQHFWKSVESSNKRPTEVSIW